MTAAGPVRSTADFPFPHLSAQDFGAVGDGRTDDQAALERAIRAAEVTRVPLLLPAGRYVHSGRIVLDGVVLFGASVGCTELHGTTPADHAIVLAGSGPAVVDLTVTGPGAAPRTADRGGNGVYVDHASGYAVRNVHIADVAGAGLMVEDSDHGIERNDLVERTGADGMYHTERTHHVEIAYNRTVSTGDDAIAVTSYGTAWVHDIDIHHNAVLGNVESRSIAINGTSGGVRVRDNHIDGGTAGVALTSHAGWGTGRTAGVEVTGNTIRDVNRYRQDTGTIGGGAVAFWNDTGEADGPALVADNQIVAPGVSAFYAGGVSPITAAVRDNEVYTGGPLTLLENPAAVLGLDSDRVLPVAEYPGDRVPRDVGGLDPAYRYAP